MVYIIFRTSAQKQRLWLLVRISSVEYPTSEQKYEKYQSFLSETFQFLEVKFSIYLNRHVLVMKIDTFQCEN